MNRAYRYDMSPFANIPDKCQECGSGTNIEFWTEEIDDPSNEETIITLACVCSMCYEKESTAKGGGGRSPSSHRKFIVNVTEQLTLPASRV